MRRGAAMTDGNPVYTGYLADPCVWAHGGVYYAIGTGALEAMGGVTAARTRAPRSSATFRLFTLLCSDDLRTWHDLGAALVPPDPALGDYFSGPEVVHGGDGRFYLYYSVGRENQVHQLRVAIGDDPQGPYEDIGTPLTDPFACYFANDPHPFRDDDGQWYLFYARDYLDQGGAKRACTGLAARRMEGMTRLVGEEAPVLRPRFAWQRFARDRVRYGQRWDWYQMEGASVCKQGGRYYCFYSAGSWESDTYSVDYGVADTPLGPYSDAGSAAGPRVLRSAPGHRLGPGHTCVVRGPGGDRDYLFYHAWDTAMRERRMCMDELRWTSAGPRCAGPTWIPRHST